jgi:uncharacterized protein (UPF0264 family)
MRRTIFLYAMIFLLMSCKKSSVPTPEAAIVFTIDAANNSTSLGSSFPVVVTVTSAMPAQGIKIDATLTDQTNTNSIAQSSVSSSVAKVTYTITGLPKQHLCTATIKVTSATTLTNTASQSFTVVYK